MRWLRQQGWAWLCVSREAKPERPEGEPTAEVQTSSGYCVRAWPLKAEPGAEETESKREPELRVYVLSEGCQLTAESILKRHRERFEGALQALHEGLSKPRCRKQLEKVQRKVGRLVEQHRKVSAQYSVEVVAGEQGKAAAVHCSRKQQHAAADAAAGAYLRAPATWSGTNASCARTAASRAEVELHQQLDAFPFRRHLRGRCIIDPPRRTGCG